MTETPKFRREFEDVHSFFCWHLVKDEDIKKELTRCYAIIDAAVDALKEFQRPCYGDALGDEDVKKIEQFWERLK